VKGQQTRALLLEAALQQFAANGYHGTSMRQIAEAAGLAVGGIYNHFSSKEEIFKTVILTYHPINVLTEEFDHAVGDTIESRLRAVAERFYAAVQTRPELLSLVFIEIVECKSAHMQVLIAALLPRVMTFAEGLARLPGKRRPLPPLVMARFFVSMLIGFFLSEMILVPNLGRQQLAGTLTDFVDTLLYGLLEPVDRAEE